MPSLRLLNIDHARDMRIQRLELARRMGSSLGVQGARDYASKKRSQEMNVERDIIVNMTAGHSEIVSANNLRVAENSLRRGEAMRAAQEYSESIAAKSAVENRAWKAEHVLDKERFVVAMGETKLANTETERRGKVLADRRALVKEMEANRSHRILALETPSAVLAVPQQVSRGVVEIVTKEEISSADKAAVVTEQRRRAASEEAARTERAHADAVRRAAQAAMERRQVAERERVERENEKLMRQAMLEQALTAARPLASHDFQEQDARRSSEAAGKAQKDFEATFLCGPWSLDHIQKFHQPPLSSKSSTPSDSETHLSAADIAVLLSGTPAVGLLTERFFASDVALKVSLDEEADPVPRVSPPRLADPALGPPAVSGQEGLPETPPLPQQHAEDHSLEHDAPSAAQSSLPPLPSSNGLRERNEHFLRELALLQRRLEHARNVTSRMHTPSTPDVNNEDDDADHDAVSLSPPSSPEKETRPQAHFAMTADQLRNAIRKMHSHTSHSSTTSSVSD